MNKNLNLIALAITGALAVAGCSAVPKPLVPDGSDRAPINSPAKIDDYKARTAEETANYNERTALSRQVDTLNRQVAELKAYLLMLQADTEVIRPKVRQMSQEAAPTKVEPVPAVGSAAETIEVRGQSVIFRVTHPFGKTDFNPTATTQDELLKAARAAQHIEIRGRTDAQYPNPVDKDIALRRAANARKFLVSNGVPTSKIQVAYMAAGGYIADNKTIEGRAKNRRVEIEAMDLDTTAFNEPTKSQGQIKLGSAQ